MRQPYTKHEAKETAMKSTGLVLLKNGQMVREFIYPYAGACNVGDPTVYCIRFGNVIWLTPGQSVEWVEA